MLISETINIKIETEKDRTYFKLGYYDKYNSDPIIHINVKVSDLNNSSREKVAVKCDICGQIKNISYYKYLKNKKKYNKYSCSSKCSKFKNKLTCLEKYGDENYNNRPKSKETCIEKYGVENPQQYEYIKNKTNLTNKNKFGDKSPMKSKIIQEKQKTTLIEKYGINYYFNWRKNIKKTLNEKYGDENYNNREKSKETCVEKYGVENPMFLIDILNKAKKTRLENGSYHTEKSRTLYQNYWLEVKRITEKVKKELFHEWNGYDYYDNEYIKEYVNLHYTDRYYPTIDHKISVKYGYDNSISPSDIGNINNLCITKRYINSSKNSKNEY